MTKSPGVRLSAFKDLIFARWRERIRALPAAHDLQNTVLNNHLGVVFDQLALQLDGANLDLLLENENCGPLRTNSEAHGQQRLLLGFSLAEIIAEYSAFRALILQVLFTDQEQLTLPLLLTINRLLDGCISTAVDTFTRHEAESVRKHREEQLAFLVHDMRSPLASVSAASTMLATHLTHSDETTEVLFGAIERNTDKLTTMVGRMLNQSLKAQVTRLRVNLSASVDVVLGELAPLASTTGTAMLNQVPPDLTVLGDPERLALMLQNLIGNALKYTPRGQVTVGARWQETWVEFWIQDNGCGIPADKLPRVFEKLESDPSRSDSVGLGLAIVRQMAVEQGGSVSVASEPGQGTTFTVKLPLAEPA